jgi:sugar phosphate isomerase/epimerase
MLKLAGFADEISPDLSEQIRVCRELGISHFELRGVNNLNVLDFGPALRREIRMRLADAGMGVASIGSPIGKVRINEPWQPHFDRFKIAVELAQFFDAPLIRIFSYYPPEKGQDIRAHRDEVMQRMRAKVDYIRNLDVVLVHENEREIYGERLAECLDLMRTIDSPRFRFAFDFGNFLQAGERPADNWPALKPYTAHIHIKDVRTSDMKIVPAGEGDGHIGAILADAYRSGYRGFVSLEPHLKSAGRMSGTSGAELFKVAAEALRKVCREWNVPLAGA